jgi:peptidyl-prolyl cis-trans isomerase C
MTKSAPRLWPSVVLTLAFLIVTTSGCSKGESNPAAGAGGSEGPAQSAAQPSSSSMVPAAQTAPAPAAALGPASSAAPEAASQDDQPVDPAQLPAVVAKLDGVEITKSDLLSRATEARGALAQRGFQPPPPTRAFFRKVLDDILGNRLLARDLASQGQSATAAEIDQRFAQIRSEFPSEEAFDQSLAARGFDRDRLKKEVAEALTVSRWMKETVVPSIQVAEADLKQFYDANADKMVEPAQAHARHVLLLVDPKATAEERAAKKQRAEELRTKLAGGADFAAVAKESSDDKQSAVNGRDLGWFYKGQTVPQFDKSAFELPLKEISPVVETRYGYHVIQVLERKEPTQLDFAAARPRIEQMVKQRRLEETVRGRINELAAKAKIEILI